MAHTYWTGLEILFIDEQAFDGFRFTAGSEGLKMLESDFFLICRAWCKVGLVRNVWIGGSERRVKSQRQDCCNKWRIIRDIASPFCSLFCSSHDAAELRTHLCLVWKNLTPLYEMDRSQRNVIFSGFRHLSIIVSGRYSSRPRLSLKQVYSADFLV